METAEVKNKMKVEVWSDIMCPFCYIGKRNYESAILQFENRNDIEINWKSFQLDPNIPLQLDAKVNVYQYLADRKGMTLEHSIKMHQGVVQTAKNAGLEYNFDKAVIANSFNAHRLIQMAKTKGLGDFAEECIFKAYFTDGKDLGDTAILSELGKTIGLSEAEVNEALNNDEYAYLVKQDIQEARSLEVEGVPFFLFNGKYAVYGAQPVDIFLQTIQKSFNDWRKENPVSEIDIIKGQSCSANGKCD
ncbi:MAG: DsbA family oxidoreductase [Bacteroidales bacterium]